MGTTLIIYCFDYCFDRKAIQPFSSTLATAILATVIVFGVIRIFPMR